MIAITQKILMAGTGCTASNAAKWAPHLQRACAVFDISTPKRLAAFLAQVGHESDGLSTTVESLNYNVDALLVKFGRHRISEAVARAVGRSGTRPADQVAIGNAIYGGAWGRENLGNTLPGDGYLFRGRGLIQTTGRANYTRTTKGLRKALGDAVPNFEAQPAHVAEPEWAALSAAFFWHDKGLNALADSEEFVLITRKVNGGTNGLSHRQDLWENAKRAMVNL